MRAPWWYLDMVQFRWTRKSIMDRFGVPHAIALHIQMAFPTYEVACGIANAHRALIAQVGH